jgi:hypothetical protein
MMRRLTEKRAIMVRMDASRCRILKRTLMNAVTNPAHARDAREPRRYPGIPAIDDRDGGHRGAERKRAVHGQIGKSSTRKERNTPSATRRRRAEFDGPENAI